MVNLEEQFLLTLLKVVLWNFSTYKGFYIGNKLKYGRGWYTFLGCVKNRFIFAKFIIELVALAVVE